MASDRPLYDELGVPPTADVAAIRSAFRRLARRHHPDLNPDDAEGEARFKKIAEAYEILCDPERRAAYDEFGEQSLQKTFDPAFARFVREQRSRAPAPPAPARLHLDISARVSITPEQAWAGVAWVGHVTRSYPCRRCQGTGTVAEQCRQCQGAGSVYRYLMLWCSTCIGGRLIASSPCKTCGGGGLIPTQMVTYPAERCPTCHGDRRTQEQCTACDGSRVSVEREELRVMIPARINHGTVLRERGKGLTTDGEAGDVLMTILIEGVACHP